MFNELFDLPELKPFIVRKSFKAKDILLAQGEISHQMILIDSGCLRLFHLTEDGREVTTQFFFEGDQVSVFESFYEQLPSDYNLQALEDCQLRFLDRVYFMAFLKENPDANDQLTELLYMKMKTYSRLFLSRIQNKPEQRYQELIEEYAELLHRIPDQYLASYLGMTPVSFSRIKKRLT
ncbi:Crp/Fnr family transcriptional regulator [Streptococcus saliviloxodontae]|uniref:CRP-like cAMP-binding protein n=1 Tax=Streptococcus saliviloxodontae TaxID=1349416 RepID=A0ABS2PMU0_9STRE|nr:Crp/Fnr family transcriptional regulator [Streptococcus saliviloxodontae]MBM7636754.1 CRP-like cAMP-binding protein [Streptococcus saliviloxodontae]